MGILYPMMKRLVEGFDELLILESDKRRLGIMAASGFTPGLEKVLDADKLISVRATTDFTTALGTVRKRVFSLFEYRQTERPNRPYASVL